MGRNEPDVDALAYGVISAGGPAMEAAVLKAMKQEMTPQQYSESLEMLSRGQVKKGRFGRS
jgi:hypothetical protein